MKNLSLLSFLMFFYVVVIAQPWFPDDNHVFRTDVLPRVDITIDQDSLDWIYENTGSDHEFKAHFVFSADGYSDTIDDIGFRLRGNTSRASDKKSFKVSFNTFEKGRTYNGLKKMNLNGEHNDPSIIRSHLAWTLCRNLELVSSRSNHVDVYINDDYYGLYINVEHIDDAFLEKRFDHDEGNLYKCLYPANLEYLGDDKQDYKENGYTLKTNEEADNFNDLILFTKTIDEASSSTFPVDIEPIFNVNGFIRYLAMETFVGHWDAYSFGKNNFYLYSNQFTGKIEFIPYDVDNTFGIDWYGIDWANRDIYSWWNDWESRPLTEKVMENATYRDRYSYFLNQLVQEYANPSSFFPFIDDIKTKIDQSAQDDTYRTMDYGWSYDDFINSYDEELGAHVKWGLKPYISARIESIEAQLELNSISPIVENVYHNFPGINQEIEISIKITDDEASSSAVLYWTHQGSDLAETPFEDEGEDQFVARLDDMTTEGAFEYYIEAIDASGNVSRDPLVGNYRINMGNSDVTLRVNEFLASSTDMVYDNYGQSEDWIEIFNYGTESVYLGDKYLSDNLTNRDKWKMPGVTLQPNEYYLIWADDDTDQGDNHANFKLSKSGESIGIFDSFIQNFAAIDTLTYAEQETNVSMGLNESDVMVSQAFITPFGMNEDENLAYLTYRYFMDVEILNGNFSSQDDFLDVAATYNDWKLETKIVDNNEDGVLLATFFGFKTDDYIEYKARINASWSTCEFPGGDNRTYTVGSGENLLEHWFSDVVSVQDQPLAKVNMYPNPSSSTNISIEAQGKIERILLVNNQGAVLFQETNINSNTILPTALLSSGIYYVQVKLSGGNTETHKVMIY